jgi:hypothetical protein
MSPKSSNFVTLTGFLLLALAFFGDALVGYRTVVPTGHLERHEPWRSEPLQPESEPAQQYDLVFQFYPWADFLRESVSDGRFPLWNPYNYLGTPFFANPQTAVLFPGHWLHLILPLRYSFTVLFILKLFLVLSGTFLWMREQQLSRPASLFGAFAFGLSMHTVVGLAFPYGSVTVLLPWLLLASSRLASTTFPGAKGVAFAGASAMAALVILAGQPQSALVCYLAAGLWTVLGTETGRRLSAGIRVAAAFLTGTLISGVQWLPSLAYTAESMVPEAPRFIQSGYPYSWDSFLNLVVPDFFGSLLDNSFWGFPGYHDMAFYSSVLLLILIPLGAGAAVQVRHRAALAGALLTFVLMIGLPPFEWLLDLPGFDLVRRNKLVPWLLLSLVYLAALGLERLRTSQAGRTAVPAAVAAVGVAVWGAWHFHDFTTDLGTDSEVRLGILRAAVILGAALITLYFVPKRYRGWILVGLVVIDLAPLSYPLNPRGDARLLYRPTRLVDHLEQSETGHPPRIFGFDGVLFPNSASVFGLQDVRGYDVMTPRRLFRYMQTVDPELGNALSWFERIPLEPITRETRTRQVIEPWLMKNPELRDYLSGESYWSVAVGRVERDDLFRALQVRYVLSSQGTDSSTQPTESSAPETESFEQQTEQRTGIEPGIDQGTESSEVFLVGGVRVEERNTRQAQLYHAWVNVDPASVLRRLSGVDPMRTAVVEAELPEATEGASDREGTLRLLEWSPDSLRYDVEVAAPAVLVVFERYSEGWQARIDGSLTELFAVNCLFRGVFVPAGRHQVEILYRPLSFRLGLLVSAIGVLILAAGSRQFRRPSS